MRNLFSLVFGLFLIGCATGQKAVEVTPIGTPIAFGPNDSVIYKAYPLMINGKYVFNNIFMTEDTDSADSKLIIPVTYGNAIFFDLPMQEIEGVPDNKNGIALVRFPVPITMDMYSNIHQIVLINGKFYGARTLKDGCQMLFRADKHKTRNRLHGEFIYHFYVGVETYAGYIGANCFDLSKAKAFQKPFIP